ncbi:glycosyltransferase [Frigidibacter sp. MR17.14]|uniref:glycosyltransferase n=1 Tax=Frigidibacter sp. MR17.14 TaxID=3126509 RepID=UPI0030131C1A
MSEPELVRLPVRRADGVATRPRHLPKRAPLGQILLEAGAVQPEHLMRAVALGARLDLPLSDILLAHGWVAEGDLLAAQARQWRVEALDLNARPPDPRLLDIAGARDCLRHGVIPWRRVGGGCVLVTAHPESFEAAAAALAPRLGPCLMGLATDRQIRDALLTLRQTRLARRAEWQVPAELSARSLSALTNARVAIAVTAALAVGFLIVPRLTFLGLFGLAMALMLSLQTLKLGSLAATAFRRNRPAAPEAEVGRLPVVSVLVPMYRERDVATKLLARIGRLDYPRELLDVLLVVEEDDATTRAALDGARLPGWMRQIVVPRGPIRTKPRAMNYALNFCRGSIVGVYDAEDAPAPDHIHRIVRRFAELPETTVCLQGVLDFYNPRTNWIARAFTLEYASWFRVLLPGLAKLGLVVPLGGTTLYFRRAVLEELGGWDAHNVTEDADLGLRLHRRGYRTELIGIVTMEEANCRALPWVKQRSRWQKGFLVTWSVHMRQPLRLWREIGTLPFLGVQVLLLGSVLQALLAPLLWSFWLLSLAWPHPATATLPPGLLHASIATFIAAETVNMLCAAWAARGPSHRHLWRWLPVLHVYNMMATFSAWKALHEIVTKPFYWDKTQHGLFDQSLIDIANGLVPQADPDALAMVPDELLPEMAHVADQTRAIGRVIEIRR